MPSETTQPEEERPSTTPSQRWDLAIPRPRPVSATALLGLAVLLVAWSAGMVFLAFRGPEQWLRPAWRLAERSGGLANFNLSVNLLNIATLVVGLLMIGFRQRPCELGLDPRHLPAGLATTLAMFAIQLAAETAAAWTCGEPLALSIAWSGERWPVAAGHWIAQLFGNALFEEVVYRGFFLPQAYLLAARGLENRPAMLLALALASSQGVFAAVHIPINVARHTSAGFLLAQFAVGLLLAGIYLASNNLFLAIGIHTLLNAPPPPIASTLPKGLVPLLLALGLLALLRLRRSRTATPARTESEDEK